MELITNGLDVKGSGIYLIRNKINDKFYIGSAKTFNHRLATHKSTINKKTNASKKLLNAVNKYGIENFSFELVKQTSLEDLIKTEQFYLDLLQPYYNISKIAGSTLGCKYSEEFCARRREIMKSFKHTEESRKKISESHKGKKLSETQLNHLKTVNVGRKHTKENIKKYSGSNNGHSKLVEIDVYVIKQLLNAGISNTFISKMYNVGDTTICNIKKGKTWKEVVCQ